MTTTETNVDPQEIRKFDELANRWWDPEGEFKPLHRLNPLRVIFIASRTRLSDSVCLDVGCGGGLLTESLAAHGASVTGIDMAPQPLAVARMHLQKVGGGTIDYRQTSAEAILPGEAGHFDVVTCMEVLEHVPDPAALVAACAQLVRPGGEVFFGTINRNPKAFLMAIVGAEYLLRILPRGTHSYEKFILPSELRRWSAASGLEYKDIAGVLYNPLRDTVELGNAVDVNYLMHFSRPE